LKCFSHGHESPNPYAIFYSFCFLKPPRYPPPPTPLTKKSAVRHCDNKLILTGTSGGTDPLSLPLHPNLIFHQYLQIGRLVPETLDSARLSPLTILGAAVPQLRYVTQLDDGMLIENTPNTNFSTNFEALDKIFGPIVIVGNAQLSSLDGRPFSHLQGSQILTSSHSAASYRSETR